jgi:hypothetical protein
MKNRRTKALAIVTLILTSLGIAATARAQHPMPSRLDAGATADVLRLTPDALTWTDGPAMLPPGARMALIEGSPSQRVRSPFA